MICNIPDCNYMACICDDQHAGLCVVIIDNFYIGNIILFILWSWILLLTNVLHNCISDGFIIKAAHLELQLAAGYLHNKVYTIGFPSGIPAIPVTFPIINRWHILRYVPQAKIPRTIFFLVI